MARRRNNSYELTGLDEAVKRIEDIGFRAEHTEEPLNEIGDMLFEIEAERWGKGWKPKKAGGETGVESGELKRSLTEKGHKWNKFEVKNGELVWGTKAPHAHLFNLGHKNPAGDKKVQPARRLIRSRKQDRARMIDIILDWIAKGK